MNFQALSRRDEVDLGSVEENTFCLPAKCVSLDPWLEFRLFAGIQHIVVCLFVLPIMQYFKNYENLCL